MSVLRGLFLRTFLTWLPTKNINSRAITLLLSFICILGMVAVSTDLILSGLAARRMRAEKSADKKQPPIRNKPQASLRGPLAPANASAVPFAPFQGCTVNCSATVPATGNSGVAVQFLSFATPSGCTTPATIDWDFGDGTPHSSQENPTHTYAGAGTYTWRFTSAASTGGLMIDTIAGGLGEGNQARQAPFGVPGVIARDPQGRGVYVADTIGSPSVTLIRFINTSNSTVTLGGRQIAAGTVRLIAGGGLDFSGNNIPGLQTDVGEVAGLAASPNGDLVYFANRTDGLVRAINVSGGNVTVAGQAINSGRVGTLASDAFAVFNGLAVHPNGEVYVIDVRAGVNGNKVYRISSGGSLTPVAGNGANTTFDAGFSPGPANNIPLLLPRAIEFDASSNLFIADSGHGRVIRVSGGSATLVNQFPVVDNSGLNANPYPSGLAFVGGNLYCANGNSQTIFRLTGGVARIAGQSGASCNYSSSNCGDDGAALNAGFNMLGSTGNPPIAGLTGDQNGLFVLDQGVTSKGRVRYINLTGGTVTVAGLSVGGGVIRTVAGNGLSAPYDGGLATGATFKTPTGVAVDAAGNLWVSDTNDARLRFINRGATSVTIFAGTPAEQVVPAGQIVTVNKDVGSGPRDGVPVNQAAFEAPQGLFVTSQGIYVVDSRGGPSIPLQDPSARRSSLIRFINTTSANVTLFPGAGGNAITVAPGNIIKVAGGADETQPGNGNGAFATLAKFFGSSDVAVAANGTIYITEVNNRVVRKVDGNTGIVSGVNLPAGNEYTGLGFDSSGRLLVANFTDGIVHRESGAGSGTFSNFATALGKPRDVAGAPDGSAYVTDGAATIGSGNNRIIRINSTGTTSVISGGSSPGFGGDGGAATGGQINISPSPLVIATGPVITAPQTVNIVVGQNGEIIFTDSNNNRIRRIAAAVVTCIRTGTITITGNSPAPVLSSVNPSSALQNSGAFTLTANGNNFAASSVVRWNGQNRTTTFVSATQLTASIPASDLSSAGTAQVTVFTPAPGGGTSGAVTFTITGPNPAPSISSLNPTSVFEGGPGFNLTVNGSGFVSNSVVRLDGQDRVTTLVSPSQLTAQILDSDIVGVGQASVTVFNPTPGGGVSNVATINITQGSNPVPVLSSISPTSIAAGSATFALIANGSNFAVTSKVRWNGQDLQTAFGSANQLTAQVPPNLVASAGTAQVTVVTPAPGGGTSAPRTFTIGAVGGPVINSLNPPAVASGSAGFTLMVNGVNFVSGATVRLNGAARSTSFINSTQLNATVLAGDISNVGDISVTVVNPGAGGTSNAFVLKVVPAITSVNAASFVSAPLAAESILAGFGTGLATGTQIATTDPLPTNLLGTTVRVIDAAGTSRDASLFFVSALQVNFQAPPGTVDGLARVIVSINNNIVSAGTMTIARVAPGLISANSDSVGVAAAYVLRIAGNGAQSIEPVARFDTGLGRFVPVPINLGPATDLVFPILYGVGFRNAPNTDGNLDNGSAERVTVTMGGPSAPVNVPALYSGAAPGFIGLDQLNIGTVPRSMIGRGVVNITVTVDGRPANTIQLSFQ